jgi:hypothetical protein
VKTQASSDLDCLAGGRTRIGCAHVADHTHAISAACRQNSMHALAEKRVEASVRIFALAQLTQRDCSLRQALEDKEVEMSFFGEFYRRLDAISGETCSRADSDLLHLHSPEQALFTSFVGSMKTLAPIWMWQPPREVR